MQDQNVGFLKLWRMNESERVAKVAILPGYL